MPSSSTQPDRPVGRLMGSDLSPALVAAVLLVISLITAPFILHPYDMLECWLPWAQASGGVSPSAIYRNRPDCNYVPFFLYCLTVAERLRLLFGAEPASMTAAFLVKLPSILAHAGGVLLCGYGLRRPLGEQAARRVALYYALCLPLFLNAALWGQADALLSLALLAAVVALFQDKPFMAGIAIGWGLAIKFQAIVIVPALCIYVGRRYGLRALVLSLLVGLTAFFLFCLPMILGGGMKGMIAAFTEAADYHPLRTVGAYNFWWLLNIWDIKVRHLPPKIIAEDARFAFASVTFKQIGLAAFASYILYLLTALWRRADRHHLVLIAAMCIFAFFSLPTQMHERYIVPAAALLALSAASPSPGARLLFLGLCITGTLNQGLVLTGDWLEHHKTLPWLYERIENYGSGIVSLANVVLFLWATRLVWRETWGQKREPVP